jgi:hypothetical protein
MRYRRHRFFGFPFRTFFGPGGFGFHVGMGAPFERPFGRRSYIRWLEEYKEELEEYKQEIEEELAEVERELADLRREEGS